MWPDRPSRLILSTPGVPCSDGQKAKKLARRCNEFLAEIIEQRPERFAEASHVCPLPDVDSSLSELTYALDNWGLDGVVAFTNANGVIWEIPSSILSFRSANAERVSSMSIRRLSRSDRGTRLAYPTT